MFGYRFIKVQPTDFVIQYRRGRVIREGVGLAFFYFAPTTSLVVIPVGSVDVPFIFEEVTRDFQQVTVQGHLTYRIADPKKLSRLLDYALAPSGRDYTSDDPKRLPQRLINHARVLTRAALKSRTLRDALGQSDELVASLLEGLRTSDTAASHGLEVLGFSILAVKPTPETGRALEAEAREQLLRDADNAIYARRNSAVEQERAIKENELNTEIALEVKRREIRETQMAADIALEGTKKDLVALASANAKEEADAKAYALSSLMKALSQADEKTVSALVSAGMDPSRLIALAFKEMAENADKIGQLNVSPDLLRELLAKAVPE
jgi:hypothetical protein